MANFVPNMKYFCYFCREESMYIYVREHNLFFIVYYYYYILT